MELARNEVLKTFLAAFGNNDVRVVDQAICIEGATLGTRRPSQVIEQFINALLITSAAHQPKSLVYLAVPYSHECETIREWRFQEVNKAAAKLMFDGVFIYSPISHTHPIVLAGQLPTGFDFWEQYDSAILNACRELYILPLEGWEQSKGVIGEIAIAQRLRIPIRFLNCDTYEIEPEGKYCVACLSVRSGCCSK